MTDDPVIAAVLEQYKDFTLLSEPAHTERREAKGREQCLHALQFEASVKEMCQEALKNPTHVSLNQAYLMLFKKYMEFRGAVPKKCRYQVGERGRLCIWHSLEFFYQQLKRAELMLAPPMLFLPPAVLPPQLPQIPPPPLFADVFIDEPQ